MSGELLNHATHEPVTAETAAAELGDALARIAARHYDAQRHRFDYGAAAVSGEYDALRAAAGALAGVDPAELPAPTARALWINAYNTLALHIILESSIGTSVREREDFFTGPHYCINGLEFTLDAIEHGVLRANARRYLGLRPQFAPHDPRLAWALPAIDPRIHFALYTGAVSSPLLRAIPADAVDATLDAAARLHLEHSVRVDPEGGTVTLPRLFRWYTGDFGGSVDDTLRFINGYLTDERAEVIARGDVDIVFAEFDWRLNDRYAPL